MAQADDLVGKNLPLFFRRDLHKSGSTASATLRRSRGAVDQKLRSFAHLLDDVIHGSHLTRANAQAEAVGLL